jgi:RNA polymerase sigma-70 factor (ECF subfamily)
MAPHSTAVGTTSMPAVLPVRETGSSSSAPAAPTAATFRQLFDAQAHFVWRSLLGLGLSETDVADASQQVFVVLHRKLDRLEPGCQLRTFVYGICLRVASDFRRRAHLQRERLCAEPPERTGPPTQEVELVQRQALHLLEAALEHLDPVQRAAFVLYEIEELPMVEVARVLGCPVQTAYSRLHAARRGVAAAMGEYLEED